LVSGISVLALVGIQAVSPGASGAPENAVRDVREVRTTWTRELGVEHPTGLTYDKSRGQLLVAGEDGLGANVLALGFDEDVRGGFELPSISQLATLAFDSAADELTAVSDDALVTARGGDLGTERPAVTRTDISGLALRNPRGATFDAGTGTWFVLDDSGIVAVTRRGSSLDAGTRIPLQGLGGVAVQGIAYNPSDGRLYVANAAQNRLYALDRSGAVVQTYGLSQIALKNLSAMTFAPSSDTTDDPANMNLFLADAGNAKTGGSITEVTLVAAAAVTVPITTATLVQVINTAAFSPPSPDPSGITYIPSTGRLEIVDSEVEEVTGAGYHGVNMWQLTRSGTVVDTGTTYPAFSKEPTGVGYDPNTNTLFISDDSARKIWIDKPGADLRFGTSDDVLSSVNALAYGSDDTEDPEFDVVTGHLFFIDGVSTEVFDINPVNGIFGDGNDVMTHFDVGQYGATDIEALASDASRNTLLVGDRVSRKIYEVTKSGALVRIIDASKITGLKLLSGLTTAPALDNPARLDYWIVDRAIDNGENSSENDGKIFQISAPPPAPADAPPTVSITAPAEGATVLGASVLIQASASDDKGVTKVEFFDGATSLGADTDGADGWSVSWNTTTAAEGQHVIKATATDTIGQTTSDTNNVIVDNVDDAPTISITSPADASAVGGAAVTIQASASDDKGVTQVEFFEGATSLGVDTNGADGWSVPWNTTAVPDGPHVIAATATDTIGQTTTDTNNITVDNSPPTVAITSPSAGATVSLTIPVVANPSDDQGVKSVAFFVDGTAIGTDTNSGDGWSVSWNTAQWLNGTHDLTARASNFAGGTTTSDTVTVTVTNVAVATLNIPVATGGDDVEEQPTGSINRTSTDLDMMLDHAVVQRIVGLRFTGLSVPAGATISNAWLEFRSDETQSEATSLTLQAEASDNAAAFSTVKLSVSSRPRTAASLSWAVAPWTAGEQSVNTRSPNLAAVVQQVIDRPGWSSGNALVVLVTGSGRRAAKSFDGGVPPILHVEYVMG
jgi:hypothetical protein